LRHYVSAGPQGCQLAKFTVNRSAVWDVYELAKETYQPGTFVEQYEVCGDYGCDYDYREYEHPLPVR